MRRCRARNADRSAVSLPTSAPLALSVRGCTRCSPKRLGPRSTVAVVCAAVMDERLLEVARSVKGFMPEREGLALHEAALEAGSRGPLLEIGTYCGKSAVYLGAAARACGTVLFTVDHHRGSEENQAGWEHHDAEVVDAETGRMDTLPFFRRTLQAAGLEDVVVA